MFELTLTKNQLLSPLLAVVGAVDKKQASPILSNVLIGLNNDHLQLTATDLEIEMTARIPCESLVCGKITIPAKKLVDIIRSLDENSSFNLVVNEGTALIKAGRSQFKVGTLPAKDFPINQEEVSDLEFSVSRIELIHLLESTHFAMSQHDVRTFLNGLLFEVDGQMITTVAIDGHRMAICKLAYEPNLPHHRFLLPKKGVQEMLRLLNTITDSEIAITASKNHFKLDTKDYMFRTRLIEARFPAYVKAIPKEQDKFVLIDRDTLKRALTRIIILAHEKSRAIILHIQSSALVLIANNQDQEEAIESLEATIEGNELKIGINATYLLDVLNFLGEGLVRISFSKTDTSILVESVQDESYQYIIMPMKL